MKFKLSKTLLTLILCCLFTGFAFAQVTNFSGQFDDPINSISIQLNQDADGYVYGILQGPNGQLDLDGFAETDGLLYAEIFSNTEDFAAIAELVQTELNLVIFEYDFLGNINEDSAQLLTFQKQTGASAQAVQPVQPEVQNPLADPTQNPIGNPVQNPLSNPDLPTSPISTAPLSIQLSGEVAQIERQYQGGTRIKSEGAGVSFLVPESYVAGFLPAAQSFQIASTTQQGAIAVQTYSKSNLSAQLQQFGQAFEDRGIQFVPQTQPQLLGDTLTMTYGFVANGQQGFMSILAKESSANNVLLLTSFGAISEQTRLEALAQEVMNSAQFAIPNQPLLTQLQQQFAGQAFRKINSTNSNADLQTGIGGGSSSTLTFDLCSNGQYNYNYSFQFLMSGPGVSVTDQDGENDQGLWQAGYSLLNPTIILNSVQGGTSHIEVFSYGGETFINQSKVYLVPSENCN